MKKLIKTFIFIVCFLMVLIVWNQVSAAEKEPDYWPTKGWRTATPESQGMDSAKLIHLLDTIWQKRIEIDSVLLIRNGYIVLEAYGFPFDSNTRHIIHSCTKSISSALVGIGIDKGFIKDVKQPLLDFFPNKVAKHQDERKQSMTLENVLTMTTGLECRDSYLYKWRGLWEMKQSEDWVQFMIDLPMSEAPGSRFEYCNGASFLLSAIIQKQTGMTAFSFADKYLFGPMGITNIRWPSSPRGITIGYGQIQMRPRDMARFGYLYLNEGVWEGEQLISKQWITESTRQHIPATLVPGYGYQWWIINSDVYTAIGYQGQFIMIAPKHQLLAVFTSNLDREEFYVPIGLMSAYIMPSIKSNTPLPENPENVQSMASLSTQLQETNPYDREKVEEKTGKQSQRMQLEEYVNNEYGFSVRYDADLLDMDGGNPLPSPMVLRRRGLKGMPVFAALVDDIPQGMALDKSADYMVGFYKKALKVTDCKISTQKQIRLAGGMDANYFEIKWNYQTMDLLSVGVCAYKKDKIIGVVAGSTDTTPVEYLAAMVKSLKFIK